MATFRVGQRVRFNVNSYQGELTKPSGSEGTVAEIGTLYGRMGGSYEYLVFLDCGREIVCDGSDLEPIQPERNQVVAWSECAWMPEHLREVA